MIARGRSYLYVLMSLLAAWSCGVGQAFTAPPTTVSKRIMMMASQKTISARGVANTGTGWDNFCIENLQDGQSVNAEEARRYRRTVYTHDDWVKHRQQDRFFIYLGSLFDSGVFQNSKREVFLCTSIAVAICVYNALAGGYTDLAGVQHAALVPALPVVGIPMTALTVTSSSLGLLLSKYQKHE